MTPDDEISTDLKEKWGRGGESCWKLAINAAHLIAHVHSDGKFQFIVQRNIDSHLKRARENVILTDVGTLASIMTSRSDSGHVMLQFIKINLGVDE